MLTELRLPTAKRMWPQIADQANREGWPTERFLAGLLEHEIAERATRRLQRNRATSQLPAGKILETFEFEAVPTVSKAHVMALVEANGWLGQATICSLGSPGVGKTHLVAGLGHALIDRGYKVLFTCTGDLIQKLQAARRDLPLPAELAKL